MNNTVIEAMSQFEIPRPILRSSVWPRQCPARSEIRHVNASQPAKHGPVTAVDLTATRKQMREGGPIGLRP